MSPATVLTHQTSTLRWLLAAIIILVVTVTIPMFALSPPLAPSDVGKKTPQNLADLQAIEKRVVEVVEKALEATVTVWIGSAWGTGVIISEDGKILTAGHITGATGRFVKVQMADGSEFIARTHGSHRDTDMGLLKLTNKRKFPYLELGDSDDVKPGNWCLTIGYPDAHRRGRHSLVRLGRVIDVERDYIRTDCPLVGGDSGGPLLDLDGRVIGIHSRILRSQTQNFHVPINDYVDDWDQVIDLGGKGPILGFEGSDAAGGGCRVERVLKDFPADKMGLKRRDVIKRIDGHKVRNLKDLLEYIATRKAGDKITLKIRRRGRTLTKKGKLASRKQER